MLIKPSTALRNEMLNLRKKLLPAEANRLTGAKTYTIAEVSNRLRRLIDGDDERSSSNERSSFCNCLIKLL